MKFFPWWRRPSSLILKEVKNYEGVNVDIKLEGLGGNRRRISGGLYIEAPPSESSHKLSHGTFNLASALSSSAFPLYLHHQRDSSHRDRRRAGAIWDTLTNYNKLSEYIPNIAASGAQLQPNGKVRIEQVPTNLATRHTNRPLSHF